MISVFIFLVPHFYAPGPLSPRSPRWWDVGLNLTVRGEYSVREADSSCTGEFFYETTWSGSMEKDDADFLLYHSGTKTLHWEAREKVSAGGEEKVLTEEDFADMPALRMNYILNDNGVLRFDFVVDGFAVPQGGRGEKVDLILPSSKREDGDISPSRYDASVTKGSNGVVLDEKTVRAGPVERAFRWEWTRTLPSSRPGVPIVLINSHKTEVKLVITPRR